MRPLRPSLRAAPVAALAAAFAWPAWWTALENNPQLQSWANVGLGAAYGVISLVALVQLARIQLRVPGLGWTTQKVFHLLNAAVAALRAASFLARPQMDALHPDALRLVMYDLPGLLFFTTYALLVLFWAEIYHQARSLPTGALRPAFLAANALVYAGQGGLWAYEASAASAGQERASRLLSSGLLAAAAAATAAGFLVYGGRLFVMLQRFPIESRGRTKKLREVGLVTAICAACFVARAALLALSAADEEELGLDVVTHPLVDIGYYGLTEVLPSAMVLYVLRKLPPKRPAQGYQQIPAQ